MLKTDSLAYTGATENVLTVCNNWIAGNVVANRAVVLTFHEEMQSLLQKSTVLFVQGNDTLIFQKIYEIFIPLSAECPVITPR